MKLLKAGNPFWRDWIWKKKVINAFTAHKKHHYGEATTE